MLRKGAPHYKMLGGSPHHNAWRIAPLADRSVGGSLRWRLAMRSAGGPLRWRAHLLTDYRGRCERLWRQEACPSALPYARGLLAEPNYPTHQTIRHPDNPDNPTTQPRRWLAIGRQANEPTKHSRHETTQQPNNPKTQPHNNTTTQQPNSTQHSDHPTDQQPSCKQRNEPTTHSRHEAGQQPNNPKT